MAKLNSLFIGILALLALPACLAAANYNTTVTKSTSVGLEMYETQTRDKCTERTAYLSVSAYEGTTDGQGWKRLNMYISAKVTDTCNERILLDVRESVPFSRSDLAVGGDLAVSSLRIHTNVTNDVTGDIIPTYIDVNAKAKGEQTFLSLRAISQGQKVATVTIDQKSIFKQPARISGTIVVGQFSFIPPEGADGFAQKSTGSETKKSR